MSGDVAASQARRAMVMAVEHEIGIGIYGMRMQTGSGTGWDWALIRLHIPLVAAQWKSSVT